MKVSKFVAMRLLCVRRVAPLVNTILSFGALARGENFVRINFRLNIEIVYCRVLFALSVFLLDFFGSKADCWVHFDT